MKRTRMINLICIIFMLVLLILQFAPFWHYGEPAETASIQGYVWFPTNHKALESYLQTATGNSSLTINNFLLMPIGILFICVSGMILCAMKSGYAYSTIPPFAAGVCGMIGFLSNEGFRLGSTWILQLILCLALCASGVYQMIAYMQSKKAEASS